MNRTKKRNFKSLLFAVPMALLLFLTPTLAFAADDGATATVETVQLTPEIIIEAEDISPTTFSTSGGDIYVNYDASLSQYDINYYTTLDMTDMWNEYEALRALAPTFADLVTVSGEIDLAITFDSKLTVDGSKFTVASVQEAFSSVTPTFDTLYFVKSVSYNAANHGLMVTVGIQDGLAGADLNALKAQLGGTLPDVSIVMPEGSLWLESNQYVDGETIETSNSFFDATLNLGIPEQYKSNTYWLMTAAGATLNDTANSLMKIDTIVVPGVNDPIESVLHLSRGTGNLTVSKTVTNSGDSSREFTFTLSLANVPGSQLDASYSYSGSKSGEIADGGTFTLKHGESVTISGLPEGAEYVVTEEAAENYTSSATGDNGTIQKDETSTAAFTNEYNETPDHVLPGEKDDTGDNTASVSSDSSPQTGDSSSMMLWLAAMALAAVAVLVTVISRKRGTSSQK